MPSQPHSSQLTDKRVHPYLLHNQNLCNAFKDDKNVLVERVHSVIDHMCSQGLNLPLFLWAISWNIDDLISDPLVAAEQAALMKSEELPGILSHWRRPPRTHNTGIQTKAAYNTMNVFALETVCELVCYDTTGLSDDKSLQRRLSDPRG